MVLYNLPFSYEQNEGECLKLRDEIVKTEQKPIISTFNIYLKIMTHALQHRINNESAVASIYLSGEIPNFN